MSIITTATATEMQNNFGRYLNLVLSGQEIIVTKNGKEVGRFIPNDTVVSYLTDSLRGILKEDFDLHEEKQKGWLRSVRLLISANLIRDFLQSRES